MNTTPTLENTLALALALSPQDRLRLIDQLAATVTNAPTPHQGHWGQNLLRLLDELGPIELIHPEIEDSTEWVRQIRREQSERHQQLWEQDE